MADVKAANQISNVNKIRAGQVILLPAKEDASAAAAAAATATAEETSISTPPVEASATDGISTGLDTSGLQLPSISSGE